MNSSATIYQQLKLLAKNNPGLLLSYRSDLTTHDKEFLRKSKPKYEYIWILRKCGTQLYRLNCGCHPVDLEYWCNQDKNSLSFHVKVKSTMYGDVTPISHDKAISMINILPRCCKFCEKSNLGFDCTFRSECNKLNSL